MEGGREAATDMEEERRGGGKQDHVRSQEMLEGKNLAIFLQLPL